MANIGNAHVFEIANRAAANSTVDKIAKVANNLATHQSGLNTNAHQISNISGLQTALNGKQDVISGYTGNISVVTGVNFNAKTVTKVTINVSNGIITSIN